jgi:hypothetical protein
MYLLTVVDFKVSKNELLKQLTFNFTAGSFAGIHIPVWQGGSIGFEDEPI